MLEPFESGIGQRALIEVVVLGLACGPLGAWVILFRRSFAAESASHGMLPGLVLAAIAGAPLLLGAAGGVVVAAAAIALAGRDARVGPDTGVAIAVTSLFGAGALLALAPSDPPRLEALLFGDPLGVTTTEIAVSAAIAVAALAVLAARHRSLTEAAFDRPSTQADLTVLLVLAATTVIAVQALGNLLAVALVLGPGAAGVIGARRVPQALLIGAVAAVAAGVAGLELSHHLDVSTGAAIALAAVTTPALALISRGAIDGKGSPWHAR